MENLTPPLLHAIREVRWAMQTGKAIKEAVQMYLSGAQNDLAAQLREFWVRKWQSGAREPFTFANHYRQAFWDLIERGCAGQPVMEGLTALESEVERAAQAEVDAHLAALPFKVLFPLLLFQFPAYLILLLGPLLRELSRQMGG